jgi:hypothetical protein
MSRTELLVAAWGATSRAYAGGAIKAENIFFAASAISASFSAYTHETIQKGQWRGDE